MATKKKKKTMKKKPVAKKKKMVKKAKKLKMVTKKKTTKVKAKKKVTAVKKKTSPAKKAAVKAIEAKVKGKLLGKVTHYYDKISVAIIDLESPLKMGDMVKFQRGTFEAVQVVGSMHIDHQPVAIAKKGDVIGLKVNVPMEKGTAVTPV